MWSMIRHGNRVACNDKCLLVVNGANYFCNLENISLSGVLVQCDDTIPTRPGDRCGFLLCRDPNICPGEYPVRVARRDSSKVALEFLDFK